MTKEMIGKTYIDNETQEEVVISDVCVIGCLLVTFTYTEDALFEERLCLSYFNQHYTEQDED